MTRRSRRSLERDVEALAAVIGTDRGGESAPGDDPAGRSPTDEEYAEAAVDINESLPEVGEELAALGDEPGIEAITEAALRGLNDHFDVAPETSGEEPNDGPSVAGETDADSASRGYY